MRGIVASLLVLLVSGIACVGQPLPQIPGFTHKYVLDEDLPIPSGGYHYLESESFTYTPPPEPDRLRVAELHLVGDTRVDEVVSFYKRQLDLHDFELLDEVISKAAHKVSLLFKRKGENEEVKIEVEREGTLVYIKINLYPT
jgi:hypothetical protein